MKANQNTLVGSPHDTTDTTNGRATQWEKLQRGQRILWRLDDPNKWSLAYEQYDTGTYGVNCYLTCEESTAIRILEAMDLLDRSVSIFKGRQWNESETLPEPSHLSNSISDAAQH